MTNEEYQKLQQERKSVVNISADELTDKSPRTLLLGRCSSFDIMLHVFLDEQSRICIHKYRTSAKATLQDGETKEIPTPATMGMIVREKEIPLYFIESHITYFGGSLPITYFSAYADFEFSSLIQSKGHLLTNASPEIELTDLYSTPLFEVA